MSTTTEMPREERDTARYSLADAIRIVRYVGEDLRGVVEAASGWERREESPQIYLRALSRRAGDAAPVIRALSREAQEGPGEALRDAWHADDGSGDNGYRMMMNETLIELLDVAAGALAERRERSGVLAPDCRRCLEAARQLAHDFLRWADNAESEYPMYASPERLEERKAAINRLNDLGRMTKEEYDEALAQAQAEHDRLVREA